MTSLLGLPLAAAWPAAAAGSDPAAAATATADPCAAQPTAVTLHARKGAAARPVRITAVAVRFQTATNAKLAVVVRAKPTASRGFVVVLRHRPVGARSWRDQRVELRRARVFGVAVFALKRMRPGAPYEFRLYASKGTKRSVLSQGRFTAPTTAPVRPGAPTPVTPVVPGKPGNTPATAPLPGISILAPAVTATTAKLRATVNPNGVKTQGWFEFGDTANLKSSLPVRDLGAGKAAVALEDSITGMAPSRVYYWRVVTKSAGRVAAGPVCTLKTSAAPAAPPAPAPPVAPAPGPAPGVPKSADYYVSPSGSDSNDGSSARPWRTLDKAIQAPPGKVVGFRAGAYDGVVINRSGNPGAPITLMAVEAGAVIRATSSRPNAIEITGQHDIRILGFTITGGRSLYNAGIMIRDGSRSIEIADNNITDNHSFGIDVNGSSDIAIRRNSITVNDTGVRVNRNGSGVLIEDNQVNDNNRMVINDSQGGNDSGASGIVFLYTTGPSLARRNTLHGNRAASHDYGYDGSAFEIYGASNVTMSENVIYDNQTVLETGTGGQGCNDNVFVRNISWGGNDKSIVTVGGAQTNGIHLRCATRMLIANNVFDDIDYWVYDINLSSGFASSIDGFRILNNIHFQRKAKVYGIETTLPGNAVIDGNVSWTTGGPLADIRGKGSARSVEEMRAMTGQEQHGRFQDPMFMDLAGHDYRIRPGSPAIDRGLVIPGVSDVFSGAAPDAGRFEQ
jgi:parallel beta-helix repeat protein